MAALAELVELLSGVSELGGAVGECLQHQFAGVADDRGGERVVPPGDCCRRGREIAAVCLAQGEVAQAARGGDRACAEFGDGGLAGGLVPGWREVGVDCVEHDLARVGAWLGGFGS